MIDRDRVQILSKALKFAQRNHHWQSQHFDPHSGHHGQHWQQCSALSCTAAFIAFVEAGIFKQKDMDKRARAQQARLDKYNAEHPGTEVILHAERDELPAGIYNTQVTHVDAQGIHMKVEDSNG